MPCVYYRHPSSAAWNPAPSGCRLRRSVGLRSGSGQRTVDVAWLFRRISRGPLVFAIPTEHGRETSSLFASSVDVISSPRACPRVGRTYRRIFLMNSLSIDERPRLDQFAFGRCTPGVHEIARSYFSYTLRIPKIINFTPIGNTGSGARTRR